MFPYRVSLIGDSYVGKTQLFLKSQDPHFELHDHGYILPTLVFSSNIVPVKLDSEDIIMLYFDTRGNYNRTRNLTKHFADKGDGAILIFDVTNKKSFLNLKNVWLPAFSHVMGTSFQFMLVGNKCDLVEEREVDYTTAKEYADSLNILYIEVSAKDGTNVEMMFVQMTALTRNKSNISIKPALKKNKSTSNGVSGRSLCTCL